MSKVLTLNGNVLVASGSVLIDDIGGDNNPIAEESDVNFIDYDGTIRYSYTAAEFANLSMLPANPSHDGLTAQGWNWSLNVAKTYVATYGKLWIGQMYITSDGKTRIYIHLEEGRLSPYLGIAVNGTATVEWGDGSANSTVTGTNTSSVINTQHNYSAAGDYVIAISISGSMALWGHNTYSSRVLWKNTTTAIQNHVYQNAIQKVEIGANTSIDSYAFRFCSSLTSITIPSSVTSIGKHAFYYCYSLASITIPNGVTSIDEYTFYSCCSLANITIPSEITSISKNTFYYCYSLASITIPSSVTSISGYMFYHCYSLASITIPNGTTTFGDYAFYNCYGLANITIPSGTTTFGEYAVYGCGGLSEIHFKPTTPPTASNSGTFTSLPTDCKIYVPTGYLSAYTGATNYPSSSTYTYLEE